MSLLLFSSFNVQSQLLIDDFSTDQATILAVGGGGANNSFVTTPGSDILGGERDLEVEVTSGASLATVEVTTGTFIIQTFAGTSGSGVLVWDGTDGMADSGNIDFTGLGGIDFFGGGLYNGISFTVDSANSTGTIMLTVYTDSTSISNATVAIPVNNTGTSQTYFVPFADFTMAGANQADFSNVGAVSMEISGTHLTAPISNIQVDSILTSSLTDALLVDNDFDAVASPGDTIRYTATISNPDDANNAASGAVQYSQSMMPTGTSLVVGSVFTSQGSVVTGNTAGDNSVAISVSSISDAALVTITYDVIIDLPLASGITGISSQGQISDMGSFNLLTDDPDNATSNVDATTTPITKTTVTGRVFVDDDGDGLDDPSETNGFSGVTVDIYVDNPPMLTFDGSDQLLAQTVTMGAGGDFIGVSVPNYERLIVDVTDLGNVLNGTTVTGLGETVFSTGAVGAPRFVAFGYQLTNASIGDFIWNDLNANGIQDGGEPGIDGVTIDLIDDANGNGVIDGGEGILATRTSTGGGAYDFTGLTAGTYLVQITDTGNVLTGFNLTGGTDFVAVSLSNGEDFNTADFGYQQQDASIGDFVWNDLDGDGIQDGGEPGLAGVTVFLDLNSNGTLDGGEPNEVSDASGAYDFINLATGSYAVTIDTATVTTGFVLTGGTSTIMVNLAAGEDFNDADFGYQQQDASIGDFVWNDLDGDGMQDGGEPGLAGVTVFLDLNSNGTLDGGEPNEVSDASGAYDFINLGAGTYDVTVDQATVTSGFSLTGGSTPFTVNLAAGEDYNDTDFGYQQQDASIGDFIWNDLNGDGVQDGGEPGLAGVTVFLDLNSNGTLDGGEPNEVSDASGAYDLTNLATGSYDVTIDTATVTTGFALTSGTSTIMVNLAAGEDFNDADFGYQQQDASIGDFVWSDLNGDGVQDAGETGLSGVTVYLDLNSNGTLDGGEPSEVTDGSGVYDFTNLATGNYDVRVDESTVPSGSTLTGGTNPVVVNLAAGEDFNDADFGYQPANSTIGDLIFNDRNGNGMQDAGEPGVFGVLVYLDENSNGAFDAGEPNATSDGVGAYDITGIAAGTYAVRIDASSIPDGYQQVLVGGTDFFMVTLTAGEDFNDADFVLNSSIEILINDVSQNEGDSGTTAFEFDVSLTEFASFTITVDYEVVAGTATAGSDFTVSSGTLTFNTTFGSGVNTQNITVDVTGDDIFEEDQTFNVVLSNPVDAVLSTSGPGTGLGTIVNDDVQPTISINDASVIEGDAGSNATMTFDVSLSGQSELPISVEYVTNEVDATADVDYTTSGGTVNFAALVTTETIDITITGDDVDESNETFTVDLSNASNAAIADGSGIGTITDDEGEPSVSINDVSVIEGDEGNTQIELTLSLSNETSAIVEVNYDTVAGSAEAGVDFTIASGSVSIPAKQLTTTIIVDVIGDYDIEEDEQFTVILSAPSNATINGGEATVTITNDDEGADLSIGLSVTPENPQLLETLTYIMTVTNNGPETALDTIATLNITDRVEFISATSGVGNCSNINGVVTCNLGDLSNGQVIEIVVLAQVTTVGNISASANVSSITSDDANASNNSSSFGSQITAIMVPVLNIFGLIILVLLMVFIVKRRLLIN